MKLVARWNHELDPSTKALVGSLSDNEAVGAFIVTERIDGRTAYFVVPVGAAELLDEDSEIVPFVRQGAEKAFGEMRSA